MMRGFYSAAAGLLATNLREGVVADNLANSGTAGYKARIAALASFNPMAVERVGSFRGLLAAAMPGVRLTPLGAMTSGSMVDVTGVDWSAGPLTQSSNPLAAAITGQGFFAVRTATGVRYTRAGDFHLSATGTLVTPAGDAVLGAGGLPVHVPPGTSGSTVSLQADGGIVSAGRTLGRVAVWAPPLTALSPVGGALFAARNGTGVPALPNANLRPGFIEGSNVNVISQMSALLAIEQAFTTDQEAVNTESQAAAAAMTQVGAVG